MATRHYFAMNHLTFSQHTNPITLTEVRFLERSPRFLLGHGGVRGSEVVQHFAPTNTGITVILV